MRQPVWLLGEEETQGVRGGRVAECAECLRGRDPQFAGTSPADEPDQHRGGGRCPRPGERAQGGQPDR